MSDMKTVKFEGKKYSVPDWANFITQDKDGIIVWEHYPIYDMSFGSFCPHKVNNPGNIEIISGSESYKSCLMEIQ